MEVQYKGCIWSFFMNFLFDHCVKLRTDVILADRDTGELFSDRMRQVLLPCRSSTKKRMRVRMILNVGYIH